MHSFWIFSPEYFHTLSKKLEYTWCQNCQVIYKLLANRTTCVQNYLFFTKCQGLLPRPKLSRFVSLMRHAKFSQKNQSYFGRCIKMYNHDILLQWTILLETWILLCCRIIWNARAIIKILHNDRLRFLVSSRSINEI